MKRAELLGVEVQPFTCGELGCENDARVFWQSRMTTAGARPDLPELTDIHQLAKDIRRAATSAAFAARIATTIAALPLTVIHKRTARILQFPSPHGDVR